MKSVVSSVAILLLIGFTGCSYTPTRPAKKIGSRSAGADVFRAYVDTVRGVENARAGEEWLLYRGGFDLLNSHFIKAETIKSMRDLSQANRKFFETDMHLCGADFAAEPGEVEAISFRAADAHYLDECFLLRDVVRSLDVGEQGTARQAQRLFHWVMRNVLPHEQTDSWTPPAFTLRRGYGNPRERALVFLALLRQAQIEGCLIVTPEADPKQLLVAALDADTKNPNLYLFDPRLGLALMSKDGASVLSLKEALVEPALLRPALINPDRAKALEAWLVCPLYALSPRVLELQQGLNARAGTINLHLNAQELAKDVRKATTLQVKFWNPPCDGKTLPESPTRALRGFLPKDDGGLDETGRAAAVTRARNRIAMILANYARLKLTEQLLPRSAYQLMVRVSEDFMNKHDLQTREMYLRGQYDTMIRRQERLQEFTQDNSLVNKAQDPAFRTEVDEWQKKMVAANADVLDEDAKRRARGLQAMQELWSQDQFVQWMLEVNKEDKSGEKPKKGVLTGVIAVGMRDYLDLELARVQATTSHEKAETAQALLRTQRNPDENAKTRVRDDWNVAKNAWQKFYLSRIALDDSALKGRLEQIRVPPAKQVEERLTLLEMHVSALEGLHFDVQKYFHARLRVADALEHLEPGKASVAYLEQIKKDIEKLEKAELLKAEIRKINDALPTTVPPQAQSYYQKRLEILGRAWGEEGSYSWMKQQIDQRIRYAAQP
ncbi:MAG: hypothetical protein HY289_06455 [Planctomycetes bacterium]|nr:hypothetical protein [Planctomycetota bacterium]